MGCPPDPYEVSMSHSSDETRELAEKAKTFVHHLLQAFEIIKALIQNADIKEYSNDFAKLKSEVSSIKIEDIERRFNWSDIPATGDNPDQVDWSIISSHMSASEKKVKQLEIVLCKTRDIMLKIYRNNKTQLSEELQKKLEGEIALHLDHRKDDRDVKLRVLKKSIADNEKYLAKIEKGSKEYKVLDKQIIESIKEFERITKLSDDELLTSRDVF